MLHFKMCKHKAPSEGPRTSGRFDLDELHLGTQVAIPHNPQNLLIIEMLAQILGHLQIHDVSLVVSFIKSLGNEVANPFVVHNVLF